MYDFLKIARALYKPTPKVEALAISLCNLFDNSINIDEIEFDKGFLTIGDLSVKAIKRVNSHCGVEIHWFPNFYLSTNTDPFCSVFMLEDKEINKIYQALKTIFAKNAVK